MINNCNLFKSHLICNYKEEKTSFYYKLIFLIRFNKTERKSSSLSTRNVKWIKALMSILYTEIKLVKDSSMYDELCFVHNFSLDRKSVV